MNEGAPGPVCRALGETLDEDGEGHYRLGEE